MNVVQTCSLRQEINTLYILQCKKEVFFLFFFLYLYKIADEAISQLCLFYSMFFFKLFFIIA